MSVRKFGKTDFPQLQAINFQAEEFVMWCESLSIASPLRVNATDFSWLAHTFIPVVVCSLPFLAPVIVYVAMRLLIAAFESPF